MGAPRILIAGGGGQLGRALGERLEAGDARGRVFVPPETELDITDPRAVRSALDSFRPDWIVNCAAYTAVDAAEADSRRAFEVNDAAVGIIADAALEHGARVLHVSTDYVFDGEKDGPYVEEDPPAPLNVYGASKLAGERRLLAHPVRSAVLRTAWLYGESRGKSFLRFALEAGRRALATGEPVPLVTDQVGCPTDVHTFSAQIEEAIDDGLEGLFHAAAEGSASWFELGVEVFRLLGMSPPLKGLRGEDLGRPARRPSRVVLENRRLNARGLSRMIPWKDGLWGVIERMQK